MAKSKVTRKKEGQAMVALLVIMAIVFFLVTQAVILNLFVVNLANQSSEGFALLQKTEGYLENSALRFLRDPNYSGESLQEGSVSCTIQVKETSGEKDIVCQCTEDQRQRILGTTITIKDGVFSFSKIEQRE